MCFDLFVNNFVFVLKSKEKKNERSTAPPTLPSPPLPPFIFVLLHAQGSTTLSVPFTISVVSFFGVVGALGLDYLKLNLRPSVRRTSTRAPPPCALAPLASNGTYHF
jgi:hypothetical protein